MTIVRSTAFVELWADILGKGIIFGRGDNPINFVSVRDVAAEVERAVLEPSLRGEIVEVGGPENLTFNQFAGLLQETTPQTARIRHIPRLCYGLRRRFTASLVPLSLWTRRR